MQEHIERILAAAKAPIRWMRLHAYASRPLTGGNRIAGENRRTSRRASRTSGALQDETFVPQSVPAHGERIELRDATLQALHTPGHASNHLCFLLEQTKMLFTGDHVMQGSTVVINPPDGDMRAYLSSLAAMQQIGAAIIAPGHGYLIGSPDLERQRLIQHRMWRESQVIAALARAGEGTLEDLLPHVYGSNSVTLVS